MLLMARKCKDFATRCWSARYETGKICAISRRPIRDWEMAQYSC